MQGGAPYYYNLGYEHAKVGRKRMASVPQNFKLAYTNGWFDFKKGKANAR